MTRNRRFRLCAVVAAAIVPAIAHAGPSNGTVIDGAATIGVMGQTTTIDQSSERAIITWDSFNVLSAERVDFNQPSSVAITLNRVLGGGPSQIDGTLVADGRIFIVNADGVVFGAGSRVDASGLLASSTGISDANFMSGNFVFDQLGAPAASIVSLGSIDVREAGMVVFVAPEVRHSGVIAARVGKVALGAGEAFTLDFFGDNLITFAAGAIDGARSGGVTVDGDISAAGGVIALSATTARDFIETVINVEGDLVARSASMEGGKIILTGGDRTTVHISGVLDARGTPGGSVSINAGMVDVASTGELLTSAQTGLADGGDITLHSARETRFAGIASSEPGAAAGIGGDISFTSDGVVFFSGVAMAGTPPRNGTILINGVSDPGSGGGGGPPVIIPSPETRNRSSDRLAEVSGAGPEGYVSENAAGLRTEPAAVVIFDEEVAIDIGDADNGAKPKEAALLCMFGVAEGACRDAGQ